MPIFDFLFRRQEARLRRTEATVARLGHEIDALRSGGATSVVLEPGRAITRLASGGWLHVDPRDRGCGLNLLLTGRYEEAQLRAFKRFLRPGATVLDIGANYGLYALSVAPYLRPGGRVIGFEPNPHVHDLFAASVYINSTSDMIEPLNLAVSDTADTLRLEVDERGPGGARILAPDAAPIGGRRAIEVPVVALDGYLPADLVVDCVKIDVEGHEERVLRGMRALIARSPDIAIFVEYIHAFFPDEAAAERYAAFVTGELGLVPHRIGPFGEAVPTDFAALRGAACDLILHRRPLPPMPDLVVRPERLVLSPGTTLAEGALRWRAEEPPTQTYAIAQGPHVYVPRGRYRIEIDGAFEGDFLLRLQEGHGTLLAEQALDDGSARSFVVDLDHDVTHLGVALLAVRRRARAASLRSVSFWAA